MHTGTKIRELRRLKGWTQEELGEKLGVKKAAIQKYEKGEIINLKLSTIKKLSELFDISVDQLIFPEAEEMDQKYDSKQLYFEVKLIEEIETTYGMKALEMIHGFTKLNDKGKTKALDIIDDLVLIDKYTKSSR